jgi:hypothetical protein
MSQFTSHPSRLRLPTHKRKGLHAIFGGQRAPFYFTSDTVVEGAPMKLKTFAATGNVQNNEITVADAGASDGPKVLGLALQNTYDEATVGQLSQLAGYHFANDTSQRTDGQPIGLLTGQGWGILASYHGTLAAGEQLAVGPSGHLVGADSYAGVASGDLVPVWAENSGTGMSDVRIRFDFPFNAGNAL